MFCVLTGYGYPISTVGHSEKCVMREHQSKSEKSVKVISSTTLPGVNDLCVKRSIIGNVSRFLDLILWQSSSNVSWPTQLIESALVWILLGILLLEETSPVKPVIF